MIVNRVSSNITFPMEWDMYGTIFEDFVFTNNLSTSTLICDMIL